MSNPESFIDEVTEEVRRDKLFAAFRKYGWIGGLLVAVVVGGTAWTEWRKSTEAAAAQAFGDAILTATEAETPEARRAQARKAIDLHLAEVETAMPARDEIGQA